MPERTQHRLFCVLYLLFYAGYTSYFSFLAIFLTQNGFSKPEIGAMSTCSAMVNFAAMLIMGRLSDTRVPVKRLVLCSLGLAIPCAFLLPLAITHSAAIAIAAILPVTFFDFSLIGILDTWVCQSARTAPSVRYSIVRGVGGLSGAAAALFIGAALSHLGSSAMFLFHGGLLAAALLLALRIPSVPCPARKEGKPESAASLLSQKSYPIFLAAVFLMTLGWRAIITYLPTILLDFGGDSRHQGVSMALIGLSPVLVMFLYPRIRRRVPLRTLLLLAAWLMVLRIVSMFWARGLWSTILLQLGETISYGLWQPACMEFVNKLVPDQARGRAVCGLTAVQMALSTVASNALAAWMLQRMPIQTTYLIFGVLAAAGCLLLTASRKGAPSSWTEKRLK